MLHIDPEQLLNPKLAAELRVLMCWPEAGPDDPPANSVPSRRPKPAGFTPDRRPFQTAQDVTHAHGGSSQTMALDRLWSLGLIERGLQWDAEWWSLVKAPNGLAMALTPAGVIVRDALKEKGHGRPQSGDGGAAAAVVDEALRSDPAIDSKADASVPAAVLRADAKTDRDADAGVGVLGGGTGASGVASARGDNGRKSWGGSGAGGAGGGGKPWGGQSRSMNSGAGRQQ